MQALVIEHPQAETMRQHLASLGGSGSGGGGGGGRVIVVIGPAPRLTAVVATERKGVVALSSLRRPDGGAGPARL